MDESEGAGSGAAPRFAYLIMTHKDVRDVEELAERIVTLSPAAHVVVHHDVEAAGLPWGGTRRSLSTWSSGRPCAGANGR